MFAPKHEIPYPVPLALLLVRTDDLAVAVTAVHAYSTGVSFELVVRLRSRRPGIGRLGLHGLPDGWADEAESGQLLLGIEYPDGRRASNIGGLGRPQMMGISDDQPILIPGGGGGDDLSQEMSFWLSPTPPDGPLTFVCAWPALGVEETRQVVEGAAFASASAQAIVLWPRPPRREPEKPPEPTLPPDGWFAELREEERD